MDPRSDDELMMLIRDGDEKAFASLYHRHKADVYGLCMRLFSGDRGRVDDTCQEAWAKVVRKAHLYQPHTSFKGWLMTLTRNEAIDAIRKLRPDFSLSDDKTPEPPAGFDLHEELSSAHAVERIRAAIDRLPEKQRAVLVLWIEGDRSYDDICRQLSLDFNTVRSLLYRARLALKETLGEER